MHPVFGIQGASYALGMAELLIGVGLIIGAWLPRVFGNSVSLGRW